MKSKAYLTSLQLYAEATRKGLMRKLTVEQYSETAYQKDSIEQDAMYTPETITILETGLLTADYKPATIKLLCKITSELYMNNALWWFEAKTGQEKAAIAELRKQEIIFKTEDPCIHLVDPGKIRRGSKPAVLALTTAELETVGRVSIDNIRNLGNRKVNMNMLDLSVIPDII